MPTDPDLFISGAAGSPVFKFKSIGDKISGEVVDRKVTQQTDMKTRKPLFWENGEPKEQFVVTLKTNLRDPSDPKDDGTRRIFAKFKMLNAIRDAVVESGAKGVAVGGKLTVEFTGEEPSELSPIKLYSAVYVPPVFNKTEEETSVKTSSVDPAAAAAVLDSLPEETKRQLKRQLGLAD